MGKHRTPRNFGRSQDGAVAIVVALFISVILGIAVLAIDMNYLYVTRNQMQSAADAGALAAAARLPDVAAARAAALDYVDKYMDFGLYGEVTMNADVSVGHWNTSTQVFTEAGSPTNAVRVFARRSDTNGNAVQAMLGGVLGFETFNVSTMAVATMTQSAKWNVMLVQDVTGSFGREIENAATALHTLLDCMKDSLAASSKLGLVTFTGQSQRHEFAPGVAMQDVALAYPDLLNAVLALDTCGNRGMPNCSGTHIGAGLDEALTIFAETTLAPGSKKAIILVSDGAPSASGGVARCGVGRCNSQQLANWAVDSANAAAAADVSIFPVFFNRSGNGAESAFLASLTRGKGIFSETPIASEMTDLAAAVCVSIKAGRLVD